MNGDPRINWGHPQAEGLRFCWPGVWPYSRDLVENAELTFAINAPRAEPKGNFFDFATLGGYFTTPSWATVTSAPMTLCYRAYSDAIGSGDAALVTWGDTSYRCDVNFPDEVRTRSLAATADNWATWSNGVEHHIGYSLNGTSTYNWTFDGAVGKTGTGVAYTIPGTTYVGRKDGNDDRWNGYIYDLRWYDRPLSVEMLAAIASPVTGWDLYSKGQEWRRTIQDAVVGFRGHRQEIIDSLVGSEGTLDAARSTIKDDDPRRRSETEVRIPLNNLVYDPSANEEWTSTGAPPGTVKRVIK